MVDRATRCVAAGAARSIPRAERRAFDRASKRVELLTEGQVLERDRSVPTADQPDGSDDKRRQHALSCRASDHGINRRGRRSGSGDPQHRRLGSPT